MNKAITAEGEKVSDIQSLVRRTQDLGDKVDWWNNAIIWALVFAALIAIGAVLTTYMAFRRTKQFADAQSELSTAKERDFSLQLSEANRKADEAKSELEKERKQRLAMEAAIAPRVLDERKIAEELKPFAGMFVSIESLDDSESWRLAGQLAATFELAGWKVLPGMKRIKVPIFRDGITISVQVGPPRAGDRSEEALQHLISVLKGHKVEALGMPAGEGLPLNTLLVQIGLKPIEYFDRQGVGLLYK